MLVPQSIKLNIVTSQGKRCHLTVESTAGIHFIKRRAIEALFATECAGQEPQAVKKALYYKLVYPAQVRTLKDEATLFDEQINKDCDLLLVKKRLDESRFSRYGAAASRDKSTGKIPDAPMIKEATANLPKKGAPNRSRETVSADEFQRDLKRILVTLVESAQNILAMNPEASKIFKEAQEIMRQDSSTPQASNVPDDAIGQLTDMGFTASRAEIALRNCRLAQFDDDALVDVKAGMSVHQAMEWLLTHTDEPEQESNTPPPLENVESSSDEPPAEEVAGAVGGASSDNGSSKGPSRAQTILESFRAYKRRKFKPNSATLNNLVDMGFEESDVMEALRVTDNNQAAACEWLLGDRSHGKDAAYDALEDGLDANSPLYQTIITNPTVQLGLSNPRCLLAFLHMLENGANAMDWLKDPDIGPLLLQISRIYTAEKSDCVFPGFNDG